MSTEAGSVHNTVAQQISSGLKEFFMDGDYGDVKLKDYMQPGYKYTKKSLVENAEFWILLTSSFARYESLKYIDSKNETEILDLFHKFTEKTFSNPDVLEKPFLLTMCKKTLHSLLTHCEQNYEKAPTSNFLPFFGNPSNDRRDVFVKKAVFIWNRQAKKYGSSIDQENDGLDLLFNYQRFFKLDTSVELSREIIDKLDIDIAKLTVSSVKSTQTTRRGGAITHLAAYQRVVDSDSLRIDLLPADLVAVVAVCKAQYDTFKKAVISVKKLDVHTLIKISFLLFGNFNLLMSSEQMDDVIEQMINTPDIKNVVSEILNESADVTTLLSERTKTIASYKKLSAHKKVLKELIDGDSAFEVAYLEALFHICGEWNIQTAFKEKNAYFEIFPFAMFSQEEMAASILRDYNINPSSKNAMVQLGFVTQFLGYKQNCEYGKMDAAYFKKNPLEYEINFEEVRQKLNLLPTLVEFVEVRNKDNIQVQRDFSDLSLEPQERMTTLMADIIKTPKHTIETIKDIAQKVAAPFSESDQKEIIDCYKKMKRWRQKV